MQSYRPQIIWQGTPVGIFDEPQPDMAYLEGRLLLNQTAAAASFEAAASQLNPREVMFNFDKGLKIELQTEDGETTHAVVIALDGQSLFVRRMAGN
ncbi:hypothetical protein Q5H93_16080 [Hymenobacter sp. ASUV-10]|uniref:Uncharacterized protein n=1 Tax=Hymenobacter aranciens TaxID=3063996 RepID=A0ABT9BEZ5_9BACT|nr:hypothetical protein [Hymenobacter sp. ASUV-10]MDO7876264.1 hypothetical protein [Hymenobacter sp. ASUV-10]